MAPTPAPPRRETNPHSITIYDVLAAGLYAAIEAYALLPPILLSFLLILTTLAVKLFDTVRLSSGQAADPAGVPRGHFLHEPGRWGVPALQTGEEDLESDVNVARSLRDGRP